MMGIYLHHERRALPGGAEFCEYGWRTRHTWGGHPTAVKRPGLSAHMSEDLSEGRIRTAVHGRPSDITELKAPVDARRSD